MNMLKIHPPVFLRVTLLTVVVMLLSLTAAACQLINPATPTPPLVTGSTPELVEKTSETELPVATATENPATPTPAVYDPANPATWVYLPVIPDHLSQRVRDLYEVGKTSGLDQHAFSKAGDCETSTQYFLAPFDMNPNGYRLGKYDSLAEVIRFYEGSFERVSLAASSGGSVAKVLSPLWADTTQCRENESPLVCEIRIHRPAILLVMFGTNDVKASSPENFELNLRKLVDISLSNNVIPVLVTKADNLEGDNSMNAIIVRVANEYELPVLNMWRAMQELPNEGLQPDGIHLTYAQPYFDLPENMLMGWPVRNLVTLQMLEFLHNELEP